MTDLKLLDEVDWSRLMHAYGPAVDTPEHLRALRDGDAANREAALSHLWVAILHQGAPSTATGQVARILASYLGDDRIDRGPNPVRASILDFLSGVADTRLFSARIGAAELERARNFDLDEFVRKNGDEALYQNKAAANALFIRAYLGCMDVLPILSGPVLTCLDSRDTNVRVQAAKAAVSIAQGIPEFQIAELGRRLEAMALAATSSDERSALVLGLGDLGGDTRRFLSDAAPGVRLCAALARALASEHAATEELLRSLERYAGSIDEWFSIMPPQFAARPRFTVVARLLERLSDFDRIADAAVAVARATAKYCVDGDWGPLLAAAFTRGDGRIERPSQHRYLAALVENGELWDSRFGNASKWFRAAGLPYDRAACAERLETLRLS